MASVMKISSTHKQIRGQSLPLRKGKFDVCGHEAQDLKKHWMFEDKSTSAVSRCYGADAYKPVKASNPKEVIEISPDIEPVKGTVRIVGKYIEAKQNATDFREIIEISPDFKEGVNCDTLTSFIKNTKAVNEFLSESKDPIPKTCASDIDNQLPNSDFDEDTYNVYKLCENYKRRLSYLKYRVDLSEEMRAMIADLLIWLDLKYALMPKTLYLAFYIMDRYLSVTPEVDDLPLIGLTAFCIAYKYEEIRTDQVVQVIGMKNKALEEKIKSMERKILTCIGWSLTVVTPYEFIQLFLRCAGDDKETENMAFFFAELGLMQYSMIEICPSMSAASTIYAARLTLKKIPAWPETLKRYTKFSESQLMHCAKILIKCHLDAPKSELKTVYEKYSPRWIMELWHYINQRSDIIARDEGDGAHEVHDGVLPTPLHLEFQHQS